MKSKIALSDLQEVISTRFDELVRLANILPETDRELARLEEMLEQDFLELNQSITSQSPSLPSNSSSAESC